VAQRFQRRNNSSLNLNWALDPAIKRAAYRDVEERRFSAASGRPRKNGALAPWSATVLSAAYAAVSNIGAPLVITIVCS